MQGTVRIAPIILATLHAMGCGLEEQYGGGECVVEPTPVEVNDWNLSTERFSAMTSLVGQVGPSWAELDDQARCEMACLYAGERLDDVVTGYQYYGTTPTVAAELCTLTLTVEAEAVIGGSISCVAEIDFGGACAFGRRPLSWTTDRHALATLAEHLDGFASLEHVSITAFEELAAQLADLDAPAQLIERCRAAADDERRHVALLVGLGATPPIEAAAPTNSSSRLAIALHNAVEGCVNETWAALLAHWQAEHAAELATRLAFATIAADETRHAELAWDLHAWLVAGLDVAARSQIDAAHQRALAELTQTATSQALAVPAVVREALGLPDPRRARALAQDFAVRLAA